jgi:hypothetical protein
MHEAQNAEWQNLVMKSITVLPKIYALLTSNKTKLCLNLYSYPFKGMIQISSEDTTTTNFEPEKAWLENCNGYTYRSLYLLYTYA